MMKTTKIVKLIIAVIFMLIGAFYTILPHSLHISSGFGFGLLHIYHIMIGAVFLIIGIILALINKK